MKLHVRLLVTTLGVVVPVGVALLWYDAQQRNRRGEEAFAADVLMLMRAGGLARCEAAPASWGGRSGPLEPDRGHLPRHEPPWNVEPPPLPPLQAAPSTGPLGAPWRGGPPPEMFAYDPSLRSANPQAPAIPASLAAAARDGAPLAARRLYDGESLIEALVRVPGADGRCAFVLARGPGAPRRFSLVTLRFWVVPLAIFFVAVLMGIAPVVRRIRRLTEAVRRSAGAGYAHLADVDGRDEIAELARAFDEAGRQIRDQLRAKERREEALRQFLQNTTHDLMIPLTVLQGHLAALRRRGDAVDASTLTSAMDEAHYMASLLHNLAIVARLDVTDQPLHRGPVDMNALVGRVVGRHGPIARQHAVTLESAVPEPALIVDGDMTLLEQAVSNLVHNAIRYNQPSGHVAVVLEPVARDRFRLRVVDDGPGIAPDELSRLIERGFRSDVARTRAPDGHGLGLHITQRVAQLHGLALTLGPSEYGGLQAELSGARAIERRG